MKRKTIHRSFVTTTFPQKSVSNVKNMCPQIHIALKGPNVYDKFTKEYVCSIYVTVHTPYKLSLRLRNEILVIYEKHVIFRNCPNRINSLNKNEK